MSIAVLGEALIDFIVGDDGAYRPHLGGSPYNVAIGLARQEVDVSYLSPLSNDRFGDGLHDALREEGVRMPITRRSSWPTSLALVTLDEQRLPTYRLYREGIADKDIGFEEVRDNVPRDLKIFHTGSLAITPSQLPKILKIFKLMHERDVLVSMDLNIRLRASIDTQSYLAGVRSLLPFADIVKASDEDLEALALGPDARLAAKIAQAEMGSGLLVLTAGEGGAVLFGDNGEIEIKAYPVPRVEDTVGAGDTFHAAFLASLYRSGQVAGRSTGFDEDVLSDAAEFACAAAAINISRAGCSPPTMAEVESFICSVQR